MQKNPKARWRLVLLSAIFLIGGQTGCGPSVSPETIDSPATVEAALPGSVRGKVLTDSGEMVSAGIVVEDEFGNQYRAMTNFQSGYNLILSPGTYTLFFTRGFEYSVVIKSVTVESSKKYYLQDVRLIQLFDAYSQGWIASDLHQHSYYSDGADSVSSQLLADISNGLYIGFLTDHNSAYGLAEWVQGNRLVANIDTLGESRLFHPMESVEVTTEFGHFQSLGTGLTFDTFEIQMTEYERAQDQAEKDQVLKEKIVYIADMIKRSGGVAQINHPYSSSTMGFNYWDIADHFDTIEIWNGYFIPGDGRFIGETIGSAEQNYSAKLKWYELLNAIRDGGKFFPATGGSDNHDSSVPYSRDPLLGSYDITNIAEFTISDMTDYQAVHELIGRNNGNPTTYLHITGAITPEAVQAAVREGRSFITNGPIILADVEGKSYGETVDLDGSGKLTLNVRAFSRDGLTGITVVKNGETLTTMEVTTRPNFQGVLELENIQSGDWIVLEGMGVATGYCITNPIFFR